MKTLYAQTQQIKMNQTVMKTKRQSNNNGTAAKLNKMASNDEENHR